MTLYIFKLQDMSRRVKTPNTIGSHMSRNGCDTKMKIYIYFFFLLVLAQYLFNIINPQK